MGAAEDPVPDGVGVPAAGDVVRVTEGVPDVDTEGNAGVTPASATRVRWTTT
jgi:hypothetical protein